MQSTARHTGAGQGTPDLDWTLPTSDTSPHRTQTQQKPSLPGWSSTRATQDEAQTVASSTALSKQLPPQLSKGRRKVNKRPLWETLVALLVS